MFRQRPGNKCTSQPIPACEDHVRPAAGHVQPVQPGGGLSHHEPEERVSYNASRQTRQLLHQGTKKICFFYFFILFLEKNIETRAHDEQVQEYLMRFESIPDMLELDHLTVSGDVTFGKNVSLKVNHVCPLLQYQLQQQI